MKNRLLNVQQAADFLGVSISTIRQWASSGKLEGIKVGSRGDWRFTRTQLSRMISYQPGRESMDQNVSTRKEKLSQSELIEVYRERLNFAVSAASMGFYEWEIGSDMVWWSPEVYKIYGVDPKKFKPTIENINALLYPEDTEKAWKSAREGIRSNKVFSTEYRIIRPDEEIRWVVNRARTELDQQGRPVRIAGVVRDITERRLAEQRLEILISGIDDHLVTYDRKWRYVFVNDAAARLLGTSKEELIGKCIWDLFPSAVGNQYYHNLHEALKTKKAIRSEHYYPPFNKWFENNIYPSDDGVTVFTVDITARKQIEEKLTEATTKFRTVFNQSGIYSLILDPRGMIQEINEQTLRSNGLTGAQYKGLHLSKLPWWSGDRLQSLKIKQGVKQAAAGKIFRADLEYSKNGREKRILDFSIYPIRGADGRVKLLHPTGIDITENRKLQEALLENQKQKDEFIAIASHELKSPLTSMKAFVQLMERRLMGKPEDKLIDLTRRMESQLDRMNKLITDLLDLTRIEQGRIELYKSNFDINSLISEVAEAMQMTAKTHKIQTQLSNAIRIYADREKIRQVLVNFLTNAVKYSPGGKKIIVSAKGGYDRTDRKKVLTVAVKDYGIGIASKDLLKLFNRYYQGENRVAYNSGGLGLGLYIASEFIKKHNGNIGVKSKKGKGSLFYFTLPVK